MVTVACAIILNDQNQILVTQRSEKMALPLKWEFPGGKVEPNESHQQTTIREIKEELNIDIQIKYELDPEQFEYPTFDIVLIPFICAHTYGEIQLLEHAAHRWVNAKDLLDLDWAAADIPVVHQYLNTIQ